MINFRDLSYLKTGNLKQQAAFHVLTKHRILENLAEFDPILVGTIPINIDIKNGYNNFNYRSWTQGFLSSGT